MIGRSFASLSLLVALAALSACTTMKDLQDQGYKCERAGVGGWSCTKGSVEWVCAPDKEGSTTCEKLR